MQFPKRVTELSKFGSKHVYELLNTKTIKRMQSSLFFCLILSTACTITASLTALSVLFTFSRNSVRTNPKPIRIVFFDYGNQSAICLIVIFLRTFEFDN